MQRSRASGVYARNSGLSIVSEKLWKLSGVIYVFWNYYVLPDFGVIVRIIYIENKKTGCEIYWGQVFYSFSNLDKKRSAQFVTLRWQVIAGF